MTHPAPDCLIDVCHLRYRYKTAETDALSGVNLAIRESSCFGVLGPNGAGKTTLLSILCGLMPVQEGKLTLLGEPVTDSRQLRAACGLVPQEYAFYPMLTALENIQFFAGLGTLNNTEKSAQIARVIEICGLADVLHKRAGTYSGGLKRRLNLAIGLVNRPRILFLDEPTVGIDAQSRRFILEAINRLKQEGMTIVYTSHYMEEIQTVCDDIAVIDHGRLLVQGKLAELLDSSKDSLLKIRLSNPLPEHLVQSLQAIAALQFDNNLINSQAGINAGEFSAIINCLNQSDIEIAELHYGVSRLEDMYLALTKSDLRE